VAFGTRLAGFGAVTENFAALIVVILHERARGVIGDEIELVPEAIELLLALLVEDQLHERRIVAEVAHGVVIARAQKRPLSSESSGK
jgi:hypothetical protein